MSSDLDRWWYWVEPVSDTSKKKIASKHCFMKGRDILLMIRDQDRRYDDVSDEETLEDFLIVHWCSEAPPIRKLWGLKNDGL